MLEMKRGAVQCSASTQVGQNAGEIMAVSGTFELELELAYLAEVRSFKSRFHSGLWVKNK
jgi:hypothetical protein